jgi:hypothetical protein
MGTIAIVWPERMKCEAGPTAAKRHSHALDPPYLPSRSCRSRQRLEFELDAVPLD